jgi:hypothetical protein
VKRLFHDHGHVFGVFDQKIVLHDGAGDAHCVAFLESVQPNRVGGYLARDDHHGNAVHIGRGNAGDGIGHARTGCDQRHAYIAGRAGIAVSGMHSGLFMPNQHMLNRVLLVKSVVDMQHSATGVAPNVLDVFSLQGLDQDFRASKFGRVGGG